MRAEDPLVTELERAGIRGLIGHGEFLRGYCPFHGGSKGRTLSFSRVSGRWSCFSTRCPHHSGGGAAYLLYLGGLGMDQAKARVQSMGLGSVPEKRATGIVDQRTLDKSGKVQGSHLAAWRVNWWAADYLYQSECLNRHPDGDRSSREWVHYKALRFMLRRGASPDALTMMDIGVDGESNTLTFPLRNPDGGLEGVARRVPESNKQYIIGGSVYSTSDIRYRYFKVSRGEFLWGWSEQRDVIRAGGDIVVVEGYADALCLMSMGVAAVAKTSSKLTQSQLDMLASVSNRVLLWPDRDKAGLEGVADDVTRMLPRGNTLVVIPRHSDPAETPKLSAQACLRSAVEPHVYLSSLTEIMVYP